MNTQKKCDCGVLLAGETFFCEACGRPVDKNAPAGANAAPPPPPPKPVADEAQKQKMPPIPLAAKTPPSPPQFSNVKAMPPLHKTAGGSGLPRFQHLGAESNLKKSKTSTKWAIGAVLVCLTAIAVYFFLIKPTSDGAATLDMRPTKKEIVAQGVLNGENRVLETEENVRMIISPITVSGDALATITELEVPRNKHVEIEAYDFHIETDQPLKGVIQLEIPYDPRNLPKNTEPEEWLVGVYYNEESEKWERVDYEIDSARSTLVINTAHLSPFGSLRWIDPPEPGVSGQTLDLVSTMTKRQRDATFKISDFAIFYTDKTGTLNEYAYSYNEEMAFENALNTSIVPALHEMSSFEHETETQALINLGLSCVGTGVSIPEHSATTALYYGIETQMFSAKRLLDIKNNYSRLGWYVTLLQLGSDLYYKKPWSETIFNLVKGAVYRYGEDAVKAIAAKIAGAAVGVSAGSMVAIALAGYFFYEISKPFLQKTIESALKYQATNRDENRKALGAYQEYYKKAGIACNQRSWIDIIERLNKEALQSPGNNKDVVFKKLVDKEIDNYVQKFWNLPMDAKVDYLVNSRTGFLYGELNRIHFIGFDAKPFNRYIHDLKTDRTLTLYRETTTGFTKRQVEGLLSPSNSYIGPENNRALATTFLAEIESGSKAIIKYEINEAHKTDIMKQVDDAMWVLSQANYSIAKNRLHRTYEIERETLNSVITLQYITATPPSVRPEFADHWVAPIFKEEKSPAETRKWAVKLNGQGSGRVDFTTLAFVKAGGFSQVGVYPQGDIFYPGLSPKLIVDLENLDRGVNKVFLADSTIKVTILGERLIEYELGEGETEYKHAFRARANPPDDYEFAWSFGDGNSTTDSRRKGRDSQAENSFKGGYFNVEVKLVDRKTGEELANDVVNVAVIEETQKYDLHECERWTAARSGGYGTTMNYWDMGGLPNGAIVDFRFNAHSVPDKFVVKYEGKVVFDSGWRGDQSSYNRNPGLYPGGLSGPGSGSVDGLFTKSRSNTFQVIVFGPESGTAWDYSFMARCSPPNK